MSGREQQDRPLIVVEGDAHSLDHVATRFRERGWTVRRGWSATGPPWDLGAQRAVFVGAVTRHAEVGAVVLLAARGAGIVASVPPGASWTARLVADLQRLGDVEFRTEERRRPLLSSDEGAVLELLAQGHTLAGAAEELHISRRTAARRVASARARLGAPSTVEAVLMWKAERRAR